MIAQLMKTVEYCKLREHNQQIVVSSHPDRHFLRTMCYAHAATTKKGPDFP
jgi:hypothetical protein